MTLDDLEKEPLFAEWYTSHKVFERLSAIKNFYTVIFDRSCGFIETPLTKNFINTKCVLYPSIEGTIDSINILLNNGHINEVGGSRPTVFLTHLIDSYFALMFLR